MIFTTISISIFFSIAKLSPTTASDKPSAVITQNRAMTAVSSSNKATKQAQRKLEIWFLQKFQDFKVFPL